MNYIKTILFLLCSFFLTSMVHAQSSTDQRREMKREIFKTFHKRSYTGEYPLCKIPTLPSTTYQTIKRAKTEAPLFTDRVWFPGEWEEVKAIILTPYYENHVPGHEDDLTWNAEPMVKDYANYYHKNEAGKWEIEGSGPYITSMDTESDMGKVFLRLMDGIQKGGAEAWVRVSQKSDTALVYQALKRMGLRHDRLRFIFGQGSSIWYRDCGPICFYYGNEDRLAMLDFFYRRFNRALDDEIPSLLHRQMGIPNYITDFVWEGGNCLVDGAGALVTSDAVYTINNDTIGPVEWDGKDTCTIRNKYKPVLTKDEVRQALQEMLGQRATHIVPRFLYDGGTGHMDLYADAWNENGFVFSGMPERYGDWHDYITESGNITYLNEQKSFSGRNYYTMARLPFPSDENGDFFKDENEYNLQYSRTYGKHHLHPQR